LFFDRLGDRGQQSFAGSEVVDEHPVAGADRRGELAQTEVGDPGVEGVADGELSGAEHDEPSSQALVGRGRRERNGAGH